MNNKKYQKFDKTLDFIKRLITDNNITKHIFIKDFKYGTIDYYGSNVDVYIEDYKDILKIKNILEKKGFKKEFFSFEYDKLMFFPPNGNDELTKIHLYPYIGWYTLRFNFLKNNDFSKHLVNKDNFLIFNDLTEIVLILFHGYFEDREIPNYDVVHLKKIIEKNNFQLSDFQKILKDDYYQKFIELYKIFQENRENKEIKFYDTVNLFRFILKTDNKIHSKLYYMLIHILKKLKIIQG